MERLHYRSTSLIDLQAELRQQELEREARAAIDRPPRPRRRAGGLGLRGIARRLFA